MNSDVGTSVAEVEPPVDIAAAPREMSLVATLCGRRAGKNTCGYFPLQSLVGEGGGAINKLVCGARGWRGSGGERYL